MHQQAWSTFDIKSLDEDRRIIEGIASTPTTDRQDDIVESLGASYTLPLPFMWQHGKDPFVGQTPVGHLIAASPTKTGIPVRIQMERSDRPGRLKDILDFAWEAVQKRLVRGLSIGFKPLVDPEPIKGTFGVRIPKWEWLELSAVTIPANADASILSIKHFDVGLPATGTEADRRRSLSPGASGSTRVVHLMTPQEPKMKITEQIKSFEATRQAKAARRDAIMQASADAGTTLDVAQTEEYDTLVDEIKSVDAHLHRLAALEEANKLAAKAIVVTDQTSGTAARTSQVITVKDTLPPDLQFSRMVLCKAASFLQCSKGNFVTPLQIAKAWYPESKQVHDYLIAKTAVTGATTTDADHHAALLASATSLESAFLEFLRPKTIVGKFGTNGIPSLRRVPFNVKIASQTTGASASWVGEGKAKPVTTFNTASTTLLFTKIAAISVITDELARFSVPGAEGVVRDELVRAVIERMDTDFIDPGKAVSSGVNPASITNGVTALTSAGVSAANVLTDIQNLINPFILLKYDVSDLVLIMPNSLAMVLSLMQNSLGQDSFKGMSVNGGTLAGIPVITSQYAGTIGYGNIVIAVSAGNIALADDGTVSVDASREASIEMSDAPSGDATAGTGASVVSMFQTNSIALRAEREINWKKLRSTAVVWMDDINWGSIGSPA